MLATGERPRELRWYHAGPMLFGDWGTSRLYVLGLAFAVHRTRSSFWFVAAMCGLMIGVGWSYEIICRLFPDGGGVYSSARHRSQLLAVIGGLLLCADYVVTASMSCLDAFHYLGDQRTLPDHFGDRPPGGHTDRRPRRRADDPGDRRPQFLRADEDGDGRDGRRDPGDDGIFTLVIGIYCLPHLGVGVQAGRVPLELPGGRDHGGGPGTVLDRLHRDRARPLGRRGDREHDRDHGPARRADGEEARSCRSSSRSSSST